MAEYQVQELTLPNEEDKKILFPRMKLSGQVDLNYIASHINYTSSFTPGDIIGLTKALAQAIAYEMGQGHSVKIDGLGIFTPSLGLRDGTERESGEKGGKKRNAMSICVKNINFRADKQLIIETGDHCMLERSEWKFRHSSQFYSEQKRLKMTQDYLTVGHFMKVADYCHLTGLLRDKAAQELKRWAKQPETGIDYRGQGSHKIYMVRLNP